MARTSYAVLAFFAYMAHTCNANSVQIAGAGSMIRAEIEKRTASFPQWEKYFTSLDNLIFVKIGAKKGFRNDAVYKYATKHNWKGLAIAPNPKSFEALQEAYLGPIGALQMSPVTPLQLKVSDQNLTPERVLPIGNASKNEVQTDVKTMTLQSFWKQNVKDHFDNIDILVIDDNDAANALKLLKGEALGEPKPRFILFPYSHLSRHEYRATGTILEENGYKYIGRDAEDELHQLIEHQSPPLAKASIGLALTRNTAKPLPATSESELHSP